MRSDPGNAVPPGFSAPGVYVGGNKLRFDRDPAFADAVLETHRAAVPDAGADLLDLARAADLYALVDLAGRRGDNPVADRADALLREIARTGDLHAT